MSDLLSGPSNDDQWSVYVSSQRGLYGRAICLTVSIIIGAGAGAASGPLWSGQFHNLAPTTAKLAAVALASIAIAATGAAIWLARRIASVQAPLRPPKPGGRGAFALQELMAAHQRGALVFQSLVLLIFAVLASGRRDAAGAVWTALMLGYGVVLLMMCFTRAQRNGALDEFGAAMRAKAAQIGFWTAVALLGAGTLAALAGAPIARFLPLAYAAVVIAPCWAFVTLTHASERDG